MNLSAQVVDALWRPNFVFKYDSLRNQLHSLPKQSSWEASTCNPKNRVDSLDVSASRWRVDGATACGTQFFAVPHSLMPSLKPLRIDVFVPDQGTYSQALRETLQCNAMIPSRNPHAIAKFGISLHICRALDIWCSRNPFFLEQYQNLPFGTKLVFDRVSANFEDMNLTVVEGHEVERQTISLRAMKNIWADEVHDDVWPESVDINSFDFVQQLHDTISIVKNSSMWTGEPFTAIFKSNTTSLSHLYHELNFLLRNPPHPNVMSRPLYIVTKQSRFGAKKGVVGFVLPYHQLGSIRDILPVRFGNPDGYDLKLRWAKETVSALIHINEKSGTFYSDLRPDNVLLASKPFEDFSCGTKALSSHSTDEAVIVLCDFEQRGNWHAWCSPEVLYRQYAENLRASKTLKPGDRWFALVEAFRTQGRKVSNHVIEEVVVESIVERKNRAWFTLSAESQEKAQVFSLGLFLYCLFEGVSSVGPDLANSYPVDPDLQFPDFRNTPSEMRDLIRQCTIDAQVWSRDTDETKALPKVVRMNGLLHSEGFQKIDDGSDEREECVLDTALKWWTAELENAEKFSKTEDWRNGNFGRDRPTLKSVLSSLKLAENCYLDGMTCTGVGGISIVNPLVKEYPLKLRAGV